MTTPRLRLEASDPRHAAGLTRAKEASVEELVPWLAWAADESPELTTRFIEQMAQNWTDDVGWGFTIFEGEEVAGHIELRRLAAPEAAELGYWLRSDLCGRGLMTEAVAAVVEFGFGIVGLHRIQLHAGVGNSASIRVAEKIGFQREGLLRDGSRGSGGYYDVYAYGLLESDEGKALT